MKPKCCGEVVENQAGGKTFHYCRGCKQEVSEDNKDGLTGGGGGAGGDFNWTGLAYRPHPVVKRPGTVGLNIPPSIMPPAGCRYGEQLIDKATGVKVKVTKFYSTALEYELTSTVSGITWIVTCVDLEAAIASGSYSVSLPATTTQVSRFGQILIDTNTGYNWEVVGSTGQPVITDYQMTCAPLRLFIIIKAQELEDDIKNTKYVVKSKPGTKASQPGWRAGKIYTTAAGHKYTIDGYDPSTDEYLVSSRVGSSIRYTADAVDGTATRDGWTEI